MNKKTTEPEVEVLGLPSKSEMEELKQEMRTAQRNAWLKKNQNSLLLAVGVLFVGLIAAGMLVEHNRSQQEAAATLYQQAVNESDASKKKTLFESVASEFDASSYGAMAEMQLITVDSLHAQAHLKALNENSSAMDEWKWQARLDMAALKIEQGDADAAHVLLEAFVGKQYQQLRYFLQAEITKKSADKKVLLQKALDAVAPDQQLKQRIEKQLALFAS
ncbi:MAG: tetratricopeptide repeat protein [Mariprofundus sp.]|nr:tetratricopeptide repeat protein [Mariprofundus sp.]